MLVLAWVFAAIAVGLKLLRRFLHPPQPKLPAPLYYCHFCRRGYETGYVYSLHVRAQHGKEFGPLKAHLDNLRAVHRHKLVRSNGHIKLLR